MKQLLICLSIIALCTTSCVKSRVVFTEEPKAISFRNILSTYTKAVNLEDTHESMGVMACFYDTGEMYFGNSEFTYDKDAGVWSGDRYWPLDGRSLNFGAYAPYSDDITAEFGYTDGTPATMYYTLNAPLDIETDFLASETIVADQSYNEGIPVALKLHHLLAKATIKIIANTAAASGLYEVTDVRIIGLAHSGSFALDTRGSEQDRAGIYFLDDVKDRVFLSSSKVVTATVEDTDDAVIGSTLVIPTNEGLEISIKYQYKDMPESSVTRSFEITDEFSQDKHVIYLLKLSEGKAIEFSASVSGFDSPVEKPLN